MTGVQTCALPISTMASRTEKQIPNEIIEKETVTLGTQTDAVREDDIIHALDQENVGLRKELVSIKNHFEEQQNLLVGSQATNRQARGALKAQEAMNPSSSGSTRRPSSSSPSISTPVIDDEKLKRVFDRLEPNEREVLRKALRLVTPEERIKLKREWSQLSDERSEEHTSELQSHSFISYAVFCLKKKK